MVEINISYEGDLHCRAVHGPSGTVLRTDAPADNQGKGEGFSPTDLAAAALGTCMMTIMGIYARRHDIDLAGSKVRVEKHMGDNPRRIARLNLDITLPSKTPEQHRTALEAAARACPVHRSLSPQIEIPVMFRYT